VDDIASLHERGAFGVPSTREGEVSNEERNHA
jgi:hypothetical protein